MHANSGSSSLFDVGSGRRVTRWVLVTVGAFAVLLGVSGSPASAEPAGLAAQVQPMFSPDPQDSLSCTSTQIDLTRQDGTPFNDGDRLKVETQLAYNDPVAVQLDMWSIPMEPYMGMFVVRESQQPSMTSITMPFGLCKFMVTGPRVENPPVTKIKVRITAENGFPRLAPLIFDMDLIPWGEEAYLVERVRETCAKQGSGAPFESNLVVTQRKTTTKPGGDISVVGTLFRSGIPSPNDTLNLYTGKVKSPNYRGELLASTTTNAQGAFEFTFPMQKKDKYGLVAYNVAAPARSNPIGPVLGPFDPFNFTLVFNMKKKGKLEPSLTSWIPQQSDACLKAYASYSTYISSRPYAFNDNRNPLLIYAAKQVFPGSAGKKSYAESSTWRADTGGRCYLSWWERNGVRVSGYTYSCKR
jgi:hypothetical protein